MITAHSWYLIFLYKTTKLTLHDSHTQETWWCYTDCNEIYCQNVSEMQLKYITAILPSAEAISHFEISHLDYYKSKGASGGGGGSGWRASRHNPCGRKRLRRERSDGHNKTCCQSCSKPSTSRHRLVASEQLQHCGKHRVLQPVPPATPR